MSPGTVTIVVPTYKRPTKLRRAVESILAQTYDDVLVMVFDNHSDDGTHEVVAEIMAADSRVQYHCHSENVGLIANFNHAFEQVSTPFFGILTDDDYYLPTFLEDVMRGFTQFPQIKLSLLSAPLVEVDGTFISDALATWPKEGLYNPAESVSLAVTGSHPVLTMCIFRLELKSELHFDIQAGSISDLPILISVLAKYPFHVSRKVGGYFIRYEDASGRSFARIDNVRVICPAYLRVEEILEQSESIVPAVKAQILSSLRRRIDRLFFSLLLANIMAKNVACYPYLREVIRHRRPSAWQRMAAFTAGLTRLLNAEFLAFGLRIAMGSLHRIKRLALR